MQKAGRPERYNLGNRCEMSDAEIGEALGVSRQYASFLVARALRKFERELQKRGIRSVGDIIGEDVGEAMQPPATPRR